MYTNDAPPPAVDAWACRLLIWAIVANVEAAPVSTAVAVTPATMSALLVSKLDAVSVSFV